MNIKSKVLTGISLLCFLSIGSFYYFDSDTSAESNEKKEKVAVYERHSDYVMNVDNKEEVVGNSENVFIAKVLKKQSSISVSNNPRTQFEVEILKNIKGELHGTAMINQSVGYGIDPQGNKYLELEEGQEFLEEGSTYLFATLYEEELDWHNPIPVYGEIKLDSSNNINSINQLNSDIQNNLINEYEMAFKNQKPSELLLDMYEDTLINGYEDKE